MQSLTVPVNDSIASGCVNAFVGVVFKISAGLYGCGHAEAHRDALLSQGPSQTDKPTPDGFPGCSQRIGGLSIRIDAGVAMGVDTPPISEVLSLDEHLGAMMGESGRVGHGTGRIGPCCANMGPPLPTLGV